MATLHEALQQLCDEGFLDVIGDGGSMRDIEDVLEEALAIAPFDADQYRVVRGVPGEAWWFVWKRTAACPSGDGCL